MPWNETTKTRFAPVRTHFKVSWRASRRWRGARGDSPAHAPPARGAAGSTACRPSGAPCSRPGGGPPRGSPGRGPPGSEGRPTASGRREPNAVCSRSPSGSGPPSGSPRETSSGSGCSGAFQCGSAPPRRGSTRPFRPPRGPAAGGRPAAGRCRGRSSRCASPRVRDRVQLADAKACSRHSRDPRAMPSRPCAAIPGCPSAPDVNAKVKLPSFWRFGDVPPRRRRRGAPARARRLRGFGAGSGRSSGGDPRGAGEGAAHPENLSGRRISRTEAGVRAQEARHRIRS